MIKRIVIAGSRDYNNYEELKFCMDNIVSEIENDDEIIIISGGCRGTDKLGERYAKEKGYKTEIYPAQWKIYGRGAGLKRNKEMAEICDLVVCFWNGDSPGTRAMIEFAKKCNKPVIVNKINIIE